PGGGRRAAGRAPADAPLALFAGHARGAAVRRVFLVLLGVVLAGAASAQREPAPGSLPPPPSLGGPADSTRPPSVPSASATPELIVDLSQARVSITSAFQGESLLLLGMFAPPGEIVVVVPGPAAGPAVLRNESLTGLWLITCRPGSDDVPAH